MLKIKDDIDLKELEKFGFEKYENCDAYYRICNSVTDGYQTFFERIEINEDDRIIRTHLYNDLSNQDWEGFIVREGRIPDLIRADIVEKV